MTVCFVLETAISYMYDSSRSNKFTPSRTAMSELEGCELVSSLFQFPDIFRVIIDKVQTQDRFNFRPYRPSLVDQF